jgi:hypothetical protein
MGNLKPHTSIAGVNILSSLVIGDAASLHLQMDKQTYQHCLNT